MSGAPRGTEQCQRRDEDGGKLNGLQKPCEGDGDAHVVGGDDDAVTNVQAGANEDAEVVDEAHVGSAGPGTGAHAAHGGPCAVDDDGVVGRSAEAAVAENGAAEVEGVLEEGLCGEVLDGNAALERGEDAVERGGVGGAQQQARAAAQAAGQGGGGVARVARPHRAQAAGAVADHVAVGHAVRRAQRHRAVEHARRVPVHARLVPVRRRALVVQRARRPRRAGRARRAVQPQQRRRAVRQHAAPVEPSPRHAARALHEARSDPCGIVPVDAPLVPVGHRVRRGAWRGRRCRRWCRVACHSEGDVQQQQSDQRHTVSCHWAESLRVTPSTSASLKTRA